MFLKRLYAPEYMVKESQRVGTLPGTGEAYRKTIRVAWPAMVEAFLTSMVGIIDSIMVSSLGTTAIAAVGITTQPKMLLLAWFMAIGHGLTAVISRRKGQENREGANRCLRQALFVVLLMVLVLTAVGEGVARPLLNFAGAKADTIDDATVYFRILLIGLPAQVLNLAINAAQRGVGNTRIAMVTNMSANLVNCLFNFLLINGHLGFPALGVAGAAIATVIGFYVGLVIAIVSVTKKGKFLHLDLRLGVLPDRETLGSLISVSAGAAVEQVFMRIGFFSFAKIVAELGTQDFATHQICANVLNLTFGFGDGLTMAAGALVGQSLGQKRPDLAVMYGKCAQRIGMICSAMMFVVCLTLDQPILKLWSDESFVLEKGRWVIYMCAPIVQAQIAQVIFSGCLRGAGDTKYVALSSAICIGLVRTVASYTLCYPLGLGLYGAWMGTMIDQYMRLLLSGIRFSRGKWTKIEV